MCQPPPLTPSQGSSRPGSYQAGYPAPAPSLSMNPTSVGHHRPPFLLPKQMES